MAEACHERAAVRWPNDVVLDGRKLAGVLPELRDGKLVLGVGVNAQKYAPFVVVGLIVLGFMLWRWKETDGGADRIDRAILSLPRRLRR